MRPSADLLQRFFYHDKPSADRDEHANNFVKFTVPIYTNSSLMLTKYKSSYVSAIPSLSYFIFDENCVFKHPLPTASSPFLIVFFTYFSS